jgi:hypothetical protein
MKFSRCNLLITICRLTDRLTLGEAVTTLLYTFHDDRELAAMLREAYVAGSRMVLPPSGEYVQAEKFDFLAFIVRTRADVREKARVTSLEYIARLREEEHHFLLETEMTKVNEVRERLHAELRAHEAQFGEIL